MTTTKDKTGVIRKDELYTLDELKRRLDLSDSAWRALRDAGLPSIPMGKRKYFVGEQVIGWFGRAGSHATA